MDDVQKRQHRKLFISFIVILATGLVLLVSTLAWLISANESKVNNFEVSIYSETGMELSLDGESWEDDVLHINTDTIEEAYEGNTNSYPDQLFPCSTSGIFDGSVSRLKLYDKSSAASTPGGFKLIANRIDNYSIVDNNLTPEGDGYFVFDLFVRNGVGSGYSEEGGENTAESIYLTSNSRAVVTSLDEVADEETSSPELEVSPSPEEDIYSDVGNSIRIGFFQVGRIRSEGYNADTLRSITCNGGSGITSTCSTTVADALNNKAKTWNIWEPNDLAHDSQLINYYNLLCRNRTSLNEYSSQTCSDITNLKLNTYAPNTDIISSDKVDIYDGLNGFTGTVYDSSNLNGKLTELNNYGGSMASLVSHEKEPFIKLAGNSITKIRMYIWLEGQDVDNYDLMTTNLGIKINFGFTTDKIYVPNSNNNELNNENNVSNSN